MGFSENIKELGKRISQLTPKASTEEATKMSMILPFFNFLDMMFLIHLNFAQNLQQM